MRKRVSRIIAKLLVFVIVLQMALPMTAYAAPVQSVSELENLSDTDEGFTIKHVATDKLVKSYETDNVALTVDGEEGDLATIFSTAVFGINDNNSMGNSKLQVVSLVSKEYNKGIASVGWNDGAKATVGRVFRLSLTVMAPSLSKTATLTNTLL